LLYTRDEEWRGFALSTERTIIDGPNSGFASDQKRE
jgi:hypothetical protein